MSESNIHVTVKAPSSTISNLPATTFALSLPENYTINDLLALIENKHQTSPTIKRCLVALNDVCTFDRSTLLKNGDSIFLLSPISGG